jgi:Serine/threonine protein kinase
MPFCYECGAPVAPEDPFCGNCGIAQKPIAAVPPLISGGLSETVTAPPPAPTQTELPPLTENASQPLEEEATEASAPILPEPQTVAPQEPAQTVASDSSEIPPAAVSPRELAPELQETLTGTYSSLIPDEEPEETPASETSAVETEAPEASSASPSSTSDSSASSDSSAPPVTSASASPALAVTNATTPELGSEAEPAFASTAEESQPQMDSPAAQTAEPIATPSEMSNIPAAEMSGAAAGVEMSRDEKSIEPEVSTAQTDEVEVPAAASEVVLNDTLAPEGQSRSTGQLVGASSDPAMQATVPPGATAGRKQTSKTLEPGTLLNGRYEIVRRIGGGGMGAVYLAKDRHLGDAPRAVKEMIETHLDESQHEKAVGDFKRESLLLTSLEHSSIPTIYDYFYDESAGRFYLVMKYISGGDFASRLRNAPGGRIDEKTVTIWSMEVADVLDYLHNRRPRPIIYRDLKPANLMIDGNSGRVMLIDFGIARWVNKQEEKGVTAVGTMGYAPPELFSGKVEPRSDIYSLGATMFHLLTGSDPQDNPLLIFDFTKNPRPRQINPAISVEMERILMRAVEYKPEGRFRSAAEMREALAAHLEKLRVGDVSYGTVTAAQGAGETLQVEMVFCGFCGGRIAADDLFCAHCGAKQPLAGISPSAALQSARSTAKLVVAGTTELDASFLLQKDSNLVGRSDPHSNIFPEVDLSRFDPETKVSRRHARIWRKGETFLVEDLGSVNGTVVLGRDNDTVRLAPHQPRVLENGDKLRLGETMLHFLVG